jgi:hypothetical protein
MPRNSVDPDTRAEDSADSLSIVLASFIMELITAKRKEGMLKKVQEWTPAILLSLVLSATSLAAQNGTGRANWDRYAAEIQSHGHLVAMYPKYRFGVEGDTPSFLYVLLNGLDNPENPGHGGWGGYFTFEVTDDGTHDLTGYRRIIVTAWEG